MPDVYGPFGLFASAFFAATLAARMDTTVAVGAASAGNILAVMVNYALGYWLYEKAHAKLERSKTGAAALTLGHRYGYGALLLSWLPLIGDPLTLAAGMVRLNFWGFLLIAGSLRAARYLLIAEAF